MKRLGYTFYFLLFIPSVACASVRITEIAWMGISGTSGQFGEWIELYNDGASVDLSGWKLISSGDTLFTLSRTISENGFLLVERTTASMPDPVPGVDDEHGPFGGGGLSNEGELLILQDSNGITIQELDFSSGWSAGDATTKETMQWSGAGWVTATATPRRAYEGGGGDVPPPPSETAPIVQEKKTGSSPPPLRYVPHITLSVPFDVYQYVEHEFAADIVLEDGLHHKSGPIRWNMGDGTTIEQRFLEPVRHRYRYPGTYTIWLGYYRSKFDTEPLLFATKTIKVGSPQLSITPLGSDAVEVTNQSGKTVDLSGWQVVSGSERASFPAYTFLAADASAVFSASTLGIAIQKNVAIARPQGEVLSFVAATSRSENNQHSFVKQTIQTSLEEGVLVDDNRTAFEDATSPKKQNHTKNIIFGVILSILVVLFILLERIMAKRE